MSLCQGRWWCWDQARPALEASVCYGVGGSLGGVVPQVWLAWLAPCPRPRPPHPSHAILVCLQPKLTPQEKLKLRMQKALNRQCKQHPWPPCFHHTLTPPASVPSFSPRSLGLFFLIVKADKKAAQEKMLQQEHERQVGEGGEAGGEARLPTLWGLEPVNGNALLFQEREDELRAMARKIRMK